MQIWFFIDAISFSQILIRVHISLFCKQNETTVVLFFAIVM